MARLPAQVDDPRVALYGVLYLAEVAPGGDDLALLDGDRADLVVVVVEGANLAVVQDQVLGRHSAVDGRHHWRVGGRHRPRSGSRCRAGDKCAASPQGTPS
jgi:hypothetical protein